MTKVGAVGRYITASPARRAVGSRRMSLRGGLVEILAVTTVLGLAGVLVLTAVMLMNQRAVLAACDQSVRTTALAAQAYFAGHGGYPTDREQLFAEGYLRRQTSTAYEVVYTSNDPRPGFTVTGLTSHGDACRSITG